VKVLIPPGDLPGLDPLYVFLPPALPGFIAVVLLSVQWLAQLFADQDKSSK
jgi:hypothetical protein